MEQYQYDNQSMNQDSNRKPDNKGKRSHLIGTIVLSAVIGLIGGCVGSGIVNAISGRVVIQKADTGSSSGEDSGTGSDATEVVAEISPTVVSITTEKMEFSQFWFGTQVSSGAGSGVIISEDGYILTCAHVISGADTITVSTEAGDEYEASVVGSYEDGDIAVLKIEAEGLQAAVLGDSSKVQAGETVYAVGNPGGTLSGTVTDGIISAIERTITVTTENSGQATGGQSGEKTISLEVMQTSAAVSPGNSGGGLFNSNGELIGIVNAKSSGDSQEGLGFAIPVNTAQEIAQSLINDGTYEAPAKEEESGNKAVLNITVTELDMASAQASGQQPGVYVQDVEEGGASDGFLQAKDRIISLEDAVVTTTEELAGELEKYNPGDTVSVSVERDGRQVSVEIILAESTQTS